MGGAVTREVVIARRDTLPAFPRVIEDILSTLDDPQANLHLLVRHIGHDPVLVARVLSQANSIALRARSGAAVQDLYTATSLIGLARLRHTTMVTSLAGFLGRASPAGLAAEFWAHCAAASVCAQQVAAQAQVPGDAAAIAGLLHDVGHLWLHRYDPELFMEAWQESVARRRTIVDAEIERFGASHAEIGAWLAESWSLPQPICEAIRWHHAPDPVLPDTLVALVHVAEVLSNALDVSGSASRRVTYISAAACEQLGLDWNQGAGALFGRIDAVSRYLASYFRPVS